MGLREFFLGERKYAAEGDRLKKAAEDAAMNGLEWRRKNRSDKQLIEVKSGKIVGDAVRCNSGWRADHQGHNCGNFASCDAAVKAVEDWIKDLARHAANLAYYGPVEY